MTRFDGDRGPLGPPPIAFRFPDRRGGFRTFRRVLPFVVVIGTLIVLYVLANINQRTRPTVLSGSLDYWLLILGLSGFFIMGGGVVVSLFDGGFARLLFGSSLKAIAISFAQNDRLITFLCVVYLLLLFGLIVYGYRVRRRTTAIYNASPELLAEPLAELLGCGPEAFLLSAPIADKESSGKVMLEESHLFRNVGLTWIGMSHQRQSRIESELAKRLDKVEVRSNPIAGLLLNIASGIGLVMFAWIAFIFAVFLRII